ncbi:MAG: hypothetical protein B7Y15_05585 [Bacteroidetes bacterium 24-39-8]|nr:MAG: hypothetical protein B7Y69_08535 [Sphingobacteriia bacterium 35-40-8]OYZ51531.1 MAG: hypothetical protein B7Y15_05585 [Bacteroidetes bacterium 24-39-8]HQR94548.1 hypothetical protein [Sediminibacterium sp.]HQS54842.1 hypothetical protein [Sediminibacterium sp.]
MVDSSVYKLLTEKFTLGLFENPYVDETKAEQFVGNNEFQAKADIAMRKSIVLLRNESETLPVKTKTKVYFETYLQKRGGSPSTIYQPVKVDPNLEFVKTPEEADMILLWLHPGGKSLFGSDGSPIYLSLSKNAIDVNYVKGLVAKSQPS